MAASFKVYVDWVADGDFADAGDDITHRVLDARTPITTRYGRDQARALSPTAAGEANLELDNQSRDYSPENTSSPLNGLVLPGRSVLIQATLSGTTYTLFTGHLDDFTVQPGREARSVQLSCLDPLARLKGVQVSTELKQGLRTGEAVNALLDAAGWSATLRDIDPGGSTLPWWWLDGDDAFDALLDLVDSEGPPALVSIDEAGRIVFRDRHHRLLRAASTTVQSTWRSSGSIEPLISAPAEYNHGWKEIVNTVTFEMPVRQLDSVRSPVWTSAGTISLAAGETQPITVRGSTPFAGAIVPVAGVDYTLMSGSVSITIGRTSGASTTLFVTAVGGPAVIQNLQLQAYTLETVATTVVTVEDSTSIGLYGRRSAPTTNTPTWASMGDAKAIAVIIIAQRSARVPTIAVTLVNANNTRGAQQLSRDLSDRVHLTESQTGLDADCYIEQIAHSISQGGREHRTTFGLEKAPTQVTGALILGSATSGVLGTNKLGKRGLANPANMFILGSGTNGVLGTNILSP
jgi:hypothetical protein